MATISTKLLHARPQELGKIKLGAKGDLRKSSGGTEFRLPKKLSYFTVTTRHRGNDDNFVRDEAIHAKVGDRPTELRGMLMYSTIEENFHAEMTQYRGRSKVWSCDGETAKNLEKGNEGPCAKLREGGTCRCKPYMRLLVQLWDAPVLGYHVLRSTGWETTRNIQTALAEIVAQFGTLYHAPIKLVLYPAEVKYQEGDKEKTGEAYMVGLTLAMSMDDVARQMVHSKRLMQATRNELMMLSAGVQQEQVQREIEEEKDIADEYFPDVELVSSIESQSKLDGFKAELKSRIEDAEVVQDDDTMPAAHAAEGTATAVKPGEATDSAAGTPQQQNGKKRAPKKTPPAKVDPDPPVETQQQTSAFDESELPLSQVDGAAGPSKHQLNRKYFALLGEKTTWSESQRGDWQKQRIGKESCTSWNITDYQKAIAFVESGDIQIRSEQPVHVPFDDSAMPV